MDRTVPPGTNQASEEQSMNSPLPVVKEVSIQDVAQGSYPLRVADRLAAEVQAASGRQRYPGSKCHRRGDYPRIPAPPAWESPNQAKTSGSPGAEASPAKILGGIPAHPKPVEAWAGPARIGRHIRRERVHRPRRTHRSDCRSGH